MAGDADQGVALAGGCVLAMVSAAATCLLLFVNGSFVWALLEALKRAGPAWLSKPEVTQFLLFFCPVLLVFVEWMMIDYLRSRFRQRRQKA